MPWKDGWMKRNPGFAKIIYGGAFILGLVILALTFGSDETREFAHDVAVKFGIVNPEPTPEPAPEPGS